MNIKQAEKLLKLYEEGYDIYRNIYYADTNLTIWKDEEGVVKFRSQVWAEWELEGIPSMEIEVKKPIEDWEEL